MYLVTVEDPGVTLAFLPFGLSFDSPLSILSDRGVPRGARSVLLLPERQLVDRMKFGFGELVTRLPGVGFERGFTK